MTILISIGVIAILATLALVLAFAWRRVVPTNMVHIVQSSRKTTSYGTGLPHGNVYYQVPSFIPIFGVLVRALPTSNFDIPLPNYDGYDKDRAPFLLDLIGFFVIDDTNKAAQKAESFERLKEQLKDVMRGAARTVLAQHDINEIMTDRATFGKKFTDEVDMGLKEWGVRTVKNLELMDVRDTKDSTIIRDIMAKKTSHIAMESRRVVAENNKLADIAEIEAEQAVSIREQEQKQIVGQRTAEQEKEVGIAKETSLQAIKEAAAETMRKDMTVREVEVVRTAEIAKTAAVVKAEETRQTDVIAAEASRQVDITKAEGEKQQTVLVATGARDAALLNAEGIQAEGQAKGVAEQALLLAPVNAQITLAEKIAALPEYQRYLVQVREVEARERVGIANAGALTAANIKVIANSGDAASGISSIGEILGATGGMKLGALLEGFANTEVGAAALARVGVKVEGDTPPAAKANGAAH